jgi:hypothetical protein
MASRFHRRRLRPLLSLLALLCLQYASVSAATLNFTVTASEPLTVTGTPRIAIDVGGTTRYASYVSGSGTTALTFSYAVQPGDFDADGITIASPVDLNGGSITDVAGNPAPSLTFTLPDTSALKVQTYTAAFTTSPITETNASAVSFVVAKAPTGASFTYAITSDGGSGSVTGSGTIGSISHTVSGVDVSALPAGALTLSVTISTTPGGTGSAKTATSTPTFTGVLDGLPTATTAQSLRRLRSAYAGPLVRVRRSSDDATQDIGATVGGNLDVTALTAFCGAASCFVTGWYDQSGNGRDVTQATPGSQPRLVDAGTVETANGRPAVRFLSGTLMTTSTAATWFNSSAYTLNAVGKLASVAISFRLLVNTGVVGTNLVMHFGWKNNGSILLAHYGANSEGLYGATPNLNLQIYSGEKFSTAGSAVWVNGTSLGTSIYPQNPLATPNPMRIGGGIINMFDGSWNGWIPEIITFGSQLGTSRTTLEANQKGWYGTP